MKITFVSPPLNLSGGNRVMAIYADRLRRRGHEVVVVAPAARRPSFRSRLRGLLRGPRRPKAPRRSPSHFDGTDIPCRVLGRHRPVTADDLPDADVVVATWWETAEWVAALPPRKGAKAYFLQHYEVFDFTPGDRVEATWRLPFHKIVVARWLADLARDRYGDPEAVLVPNAVDHGLFHAPPRGKNPVPTFGLMYSVVSYKQCEVALGAFERFAARHAGARMVAFGYDAPGPQLPLPPSAEFHYKPRQAELRELYSRCDAWLFSSRSEGFGLPILEAMACRTPVIGTPVGAAPELIGQGGGYLVRTGDADAMADAMGRLWSLPDADWRAISDAAHATAGRYDWCASTDLFEAALVRAVERSGVAVP